MASGGITFTLLEGPGSGGTSHRIRQAVVAYKNACGIALWAVVPTGTLLGSRGQDTSNHWVSSAGGS